MVITKSQVVEMLLKYINRQMDLPALVDWTEKMMQPIGWAKRFTLSNRI